MATRKIKDAKDLDSNELIYFKGHAKATYLSNGATVEDSIGEVKSDLSTVIDSLEEISENSISLKEVTYSDLVNLVDTNSLIPGKCYRITDYVTTVAGLDLVKSANHPFDIIVTAISSNELSEDAKAILHKGDEYFVKCQLNAWELKYCLDNDTNRFTWADTENGKGVIWYMKDESDNSAYYDFKGVQVREKKDSNDWYYTFSVYYTDTQEDFSVAKYDYNGKGCVNNIIEIQHLKNNYNKVTINYNTIIADARSTDEVVNPENYYWRSIYNHIGKCCSNIKVDKSCTNVKFGNYCSYITFNSASNISFGDQNQYIYFNNMDDTVLGPYISNFKFVKEDGSYANVASSRIESNFNSGYYISIKSAHTLKNLHIKTGVANGKTQTIEIDECGNYTTTIERNKNGDVVIYSENAYDVNEKLDTHIKAFDTLVNGNVSNTIESFSEVVSFLEGVTDNETLSGKLTEINNTKQENLVSGTNIKTINNTSILGSGDISVGTYSTPSSGIPTSDLENTIQTSLDNSNTAYSWGNHATAGYIKTETDPIFSASPAAGIKSTDITNWNSKTSNTGTVTGIKMNGSTIGTSGVVDLGTVITDISSKQDKLTSGTNIKTINNTPILGSGDISIPKGDTGAQGPKGEDGKDGLTPNPNLIHNSNFDIYDESGNVSNWSNALVDDVKIAEYNGLNVFVKKGSHTQYLNMTLIKDQVYTLSCVMKRHVVNGEVQSVANAGFLFGIPNIVDNEGNYVKQWEKISGDFNPGATYENRTNVLLPSASLLTTEWTKNYITFKMSETVQMTHLTMYSSSGVYEISQLKLEVGDQVTPYQKNQNDLKGADGKDGLTANPNIILNSNFDLVDSNNNLTEWYYGTSEKYLLSKSNRVVFDAELVGNSFITVNTKTQSAKAKIDLNINLKVGLQYTLSWQTKWDSSTGDIAVNSMASGIVIPKTLTQSDGSVVEIASKIKKISSKYVDARYSGSNYDICGPYDDANKKQDTTLNKDKWVKHSFTFEITEDLPVFPIWYYVWGYNADNGTTYYFAQPKLELGSEATPYQKAQDDLKGKEGTNGKDGVNGTDGKDGLSPNPNLIRNSNFDLRDNSGQLKFWGNMVGEVVEKGHLGHNYFHFDSSTGSNMFVTNLPMDSGETYTLSFEFNRKDKASSEVGVILFIDTSNGNLGYVNGTCMSKGAESTRYYYNFRGTSGAWERNYITITNNTSNSLNPQMYLWISPSSDTSVSMIKWEASDAPTPYQKNQEDLASLATNSNLLLNTNFDVFEDDGITLKTLTTIAGSIIANGYLGESNSFKNTITRSHLSGESFLSKFSAPKLSIGTTYTLSFKYKSNKPIDEIYGVAILFRDGVLNTRIKSISANSSMWYNNSNGTYSEILFPGTNGKWKEAYITFKYIADGDNLGFTFYSSNQISNNSSSFYESVEVEVSQIKLEVGSSITPYVKNQDDLAGKDGLTAQPNLILNSNFDVYEGGKLKHYDNIHSGTDHPLGGTVVTNGYNGFNSFKTTEGAGGYVFRTVVPITLEKGKVYTISCVAKSTLKDASDKFYTTGFVSYGLNNTNIEQVNYSNVKTSVSSSYINVYFDRNTDWEEKSFSFRYTSDTPTSGFSLYYYLWSEVATSGEISQLKFEVGNQATPYCKHMVDFSDLAAQNMASKGYITETELNNAISSAITNVLNTSV